MLHFAVAFTLHNTPLAFASEDVRDGAGLAGATLVGEVVGGSALGGLGYVVGAAIPCPPAPEGHHCWNQLLGLAVGASAGAVGGGLVGTAMGARATERRSGPPLLAVGITGAVGGLMFLAGSELESAALGVTGFVVAVVGMPVAAGVAGVNVAPLLDPRSPGAAVHFRW